MTDTIIDGPSLSDYELQTVLEALIFACDVQTVLRDMAPDHRKQERSTQIVAMLTLLHRLRREQAQRESDAKRRLEGEVTDQQRSGFIFFDADVLLMLDALCVWRESEASEVPDSVMEKLVDEALRRNLPW